RPRLHFHGKIPSGNGFGDRRHLLQVSDHAIEGAAQFANLIFALDVDLVIQVAGCTDLGSYLHQTGKRFGDGLGRAESNTPAHDQRRQRPQQGNSDGPVLVGSSPWRRSSSTRLLSRSARSRYSVE